MNIENQCSLISIFMGHSARYWLYMMNWIGLLLLGLGAIIFILYTLPLRSGGHLNPVIVPEHQREIKVGPRQRIISRTALIVAIVGLVLHLIGRFLSP